MVPVMKEDCPCHRHGPFREKARGKVLRTLGPCVGPYFCTLKFYSDKALDKLAFGPDTYGLSATFEHSSAK
jgi:hypothetical protein